MQLFQYQALAEPFAAATTASDPRPLDWFRQASEPYFDVAAPLDAWFSAPAEPVIIPPVTTWFQQPSEPLRSQNPEGDDDSWVEGWSVAILNEDLFGFPDPAVVPEMSSWYQQPSESVIVDPWSDLMATDPTLGLVIPVPPPAVVVSTADVTYQRMYRDHTVYRRMHRPNQSDTP